MALGQLSNVFLALVILSPWQANPSTNNAVLVRAFLRQAALLAVLGIGQGFSIFFLQAESSFTPKTEKEIMTGVKRCYNKIFSNFRMGN